MNHERCKSIGIAESCSNLSNAASLLYHALRSLPKPSSAVNWAGFYILYPEDMDQLVLGPFQGHVACQLIKLGKGVCGTAAAERRTVVVEDVDQFPDHIACDSNSRSEIVVPIIKSGEVCSIILSHVQKKPDNES
jgi:L-methionine (R)-S-oxide reductase